MFWYCGGKRKENHQKKKLRKMTKIIEKQSKKQKRGKQQIYFKDRVGWTRMEGAERRRPVKHAWCVRLLHHCGLRFIIGESSSTLHSHPTSLQRKPGNSWHNVQLNAVRYRRNRTVIFPRQTTCHGPCRLHVILMAGLVNIVNPWMIHCCASLRHVAAHGLLLRILASWT